MGEGDALITIVIPAYNAENVIQRAIKSAQNQTYSNTEIIVVDDGSTDSTSSIAKRIAEGDRRIHVHSHDVNMRLFEARKTGVEKAHGDYILFLDADDVLLETCCEQCMHVLGRRSVDILHFGVETSYGGEVPEEVRTNDKRYFTPEAGMAFGEDIVHRIYEQRKGPWCVWGKMYAAEVVRRSMLDQPPRSLQHGEDGYSFFVIARSAQSYLATPGIIGYVHNIEEGASGSLRINDGSLSGLRQLCEKREAVDSIMEYLIADDCQDIFIHDYERIKRQYADDSVGYLVTRVPDDEKVEAFDLMMEYWDGTDALETFLRRGEEDARKSIDVIRASKKAQAVNASAEGVAVLMPDNGAMRTMLSEKIEASSVGFVPVVNEGGRRTGCSNEELLPVVAPDLYYFRLRKLLKIIDGHDVGVLCVPNQVEYPYCWDAAVASLEGCAVLDAEDVVNGNFTAGLK